MSMTIVLGTNNLKKRLELEQLLGPLDIQLKTLRDFDNSIEVVEDGQTFAENAVKKASEQAKFLNQWVLAEDSGLMVDALDGQPGVYSARFAALKRVEQEQKLPSLAAAAAINPDVHSTDEQNNQMLISLLADVPMELRGAQYCCYTAVSDPQGNIVCQTHGICRGRIIIEPMGTNGFGYDPYFEIVEYHKTFGLLDPEVKSCISHRARASRLLIPHLLQLQGRRG